MVKIKQVLNELVDGKIEFVSLVKNGANRSPFKIVKSEDKPNVWAGLLPELEKLEKKLARPAKETKTVSKTEETAQQEAARIKKHEAATLRVRLDGLNRQLMNLWEQPTHPLFDKLNEQLGYEINKCELELATYEVDEQEQNRQVMVSGSAFFRRGGSSVYAAADQYDSANERHNAVQKAESTIDLRDPGFTTTDPAEVSKIDLGSGFKV